jgi:predicted RNA-binding Zn ribbon-like protein
MSDRPASPPPFEWVGGAPALDFINTVTWSAPARTNERLRSYADLVRWAQHAGLANPAESRSLHRQAAARPREAGRVFLRALHLRDALREVFAAHAVGAEPDRAAMDRLNRFIGQALGRLRLGRAEGRWAWEWAPRKDLERPLWRTAWSAAQLLTSAELAALRQCANDQCGWVFLDRSRNHTRRWCDMRVCGNNEKARRFYRRRAGREPA